MQTHVIGPLASVGKYLQADIKGAFQGRRWPGPLKHRIRECKDRVGIRFAHKHTNKGKTLAEYITKSGVE